MTGRWQREGVHAGTRADPVVVKHLNGVPWHAASMPWVLHRCRQKTNFLRRSAGRTAGSARSPRAARPSARAAPLLISPRTPAGAVTPSVPSAYTTIDQESNVELCLTLPHQWIESPAIPSVRSTSWRGGDIPMAIALVIIAAFIIGARLIYWAARIRQDARDAAAAEARQQKAAA